MSVGRFNKWLLASWLLVFVGVVTASVLSPAHAEAAYRVLGATMVVVGAVLALNVHGSADYGSRIVANLRSGPRILASPIRYRVFACGLAVVGLCMLAFGAHPGSS